MDPILSEEQRLLDESAAALMDRHAGARRLRARRDSDTALDEGLWRGIVEAGWLSILTPAEAAGLGLGMTDLAVVLVQAGRNLNTAPICAAAVAASAIAEGDSAALRDEALPALLAGERLVAPALQDSPVALEAPEAAVRARASGRGFRLDGARPAVPDAAAAGGFLMPAHGPEGAMLCHVPATAAGLDTAVRRTVDGGGTGALALSDVEIGREAVVAGPNRASAMIARMRDTMLVGLSAELLGVMTQALESAIEYLKVREQFGRPIGSFQALQHRAVDGYIDVEVTRSLLFQVCAAFDDGRGTPEMAAVLKAKASAAALRVTKSAIQMHGGIGFTDEHDIGLYLKRAMALSAQYGNEAIQRRRYAALAGIAP